MLFRYPGPWAGELHSTLGKHYCELITAWAIQNGNDTDKPNKKQKPIAGEEFLRRIPDPADRALAGFIIAERNRLRGEVNLLKSKSNIVIDRRPPLGDIRHANGGLIQILPQGAELLPTEREALEKATDPTWLKDHGMEEGTHHQLLKDNGRELFPMGFLSAIRKMVMHFKVDKN